MSKSSDSFLNLENAEASIESTKKKPAKSEQATKNEPKNKKPKKKTDAARIEEGTLVKRLVALEPEMIQRIKMEQLERFDEKLTISDILSEALHEHFGISDK